MKLTVIGMDIAKHVFQLHAINPVGHRRNRARQTQAWPAPGFLCETRAFLGSDGSLWRRTPLGQATAGAWSRRQADLRPLSPAFVLRNKTDATDARAIWTAVQQPDARFVAIKSEAQQAILALHRLRAQLMKFRIMQTNALRGLLHEFGQTLPEGYQALAKAIPDALAVAAEHLPAILVDSLREQWARVQATDKDIAILEHRLKIALRENQQCQRIAEIPGVGLLTATAAVATIGDPGTFRSGREFAAWLGLVPRQVGTGGKVRQLGLSKRGDTYLRTLLIHGARAVITRGIRSPWLDSLLQRRPFNVVVAAMANKLARTIWAVLYRGTRYHGATTKAA